MAAELSRRLQRISQQDVERIKTLFKEAELPTKGPGISSEQYLAAMQLDKKVESGAIRFILLNRIGEAMLADNIPTQTLSETLSACVADG